MSNSRCFPYVIRYVASGNERTSRSDMENVAYGRTLTYGTCAIFGSIYSFRINVYRRSHLTGTTNQRLDKQRYQADVVSLMVKIPNGTIIHSTHTGLIPNDCIPLAARRAHLFKELDQALISIGVFCDNGCMALFDDTQVVIFDNKKQRNFDERSQKHTYWPLHARLRTKD